MDEHKQKRLADKLALVRAQRRDAQRRDVEAVRAREYDMAARNWRERFFLATGDALGQESIVPLSDADRISNEYYAKVNDVSTCHLDIPVPSKGEELVFSFLQEAARQIDLYVPTVLVLSGEAQRVTYGFETLQYTIVLVARVRCSSIFTNAATLMEKHSRTLAVATDSLSTGLDLHYNIYGQTTTLEVRWWGEEFGIGEAIRRLSLWTG